MFSYRQLRANFPHRGGPNDTQEGGLRILAERAGQVHSRSVIFEIQTGGGKTALGFTFLRTLERRGRGPLFFVVPTKTLVLQVQQLHPEVRVVYGRNEHSCLYYEEEFTADDVPCARLRDCPHRVNQETGRTFERGAEPCPYLQQKYEARRGGIIACTTAFYFFTQLFSREWETPAGLVLDEAHTVASTIRNVLSFEVTDYHLERCVELLQRIGSEEARTLERFRKRMIRIIRSKRPRERTTLTTEELESLLEILEEIDVGALDRRVEQAISEGEIDPREEREVLRQLDVVFRDIRHYITSIRLSLPEGERNPLSYVYSYYKEEREGQERAQYRLFIKSYYVVPLIRKLLSPFTVSMSATIGDPGVFGFETGIRSPCFTFPSDFPAVNTRVFMPTDTPDLSMRAQRRSRGSMARTLRSIARACRTFADNGHRSLVVLVSNSELERFLRLAEEEGVDAVSYGNGVGPKEAVQAFKDGSGDVLAGTVSNYGKGVDLPRGLAPVIFFLRPGYPNPTDPGTIFEERRFGSQRWLLWNWRVMMEALQVRGRNVRSPSDLGVTIFVSQQFRRFVFASLPEWLKPAYRRKLTLEESIQETLALLSR